MIGKYDETCEVVDRREAMPKFGVRWLYTTIKQFHRAVKSMLSNLSRYMPLLSFFSFNCEMMVDIMGLFLLVCF